MINVKLKAHIKAMSGTMEIIIIASVIALLADTLWLGHDMYENGFGLWYLMVGIGLLSATLITAWALRKHHLDTVQNGIKLLLIEKVTQQKQRNRVKRHLELVRCNKAR